MVKWTYGSLEEPNNGLKYSDDPDNSSEILFGEAKQQGSVNCSNYGHL